MGEGSGPYSVEIFVPGDELASSSPPKLGGVLDRLLVHALIVLQSMNVRSGMMIEQFGMTELFRVSGFENNLHIHNMST
jgi:hypothetical protein